DGPLRHEHPPVLRRRLGPPLDRRRLRSLEPESAAGGVSGRGWGEARLHRQRRALPGGVGGARQSPGDRRRPPQPGSHRRESGAARLRVRRVPLARLRTIPPLAIVAEAPPWHATFLGLAPSPPSLLSPPGRLAPTPCATPSRPIG